MHSMRKVLYRLGYRPKLRSIFFSPSLDLRYSEGVEGGKLGELCWPCFLEDGYDGCTSSGNRDDCPCCVNNHDREKVK
jgi:hypothetical protein